ncbi:MAG: formyltransferase family protein [Candidatus Levyibacteriota bacterium]
MVEGLKEFNNKKITNKKVFYWGSKPLGYKCFKYLLNIIIKKYKGVKIIGVCVSEKDIKKDGTRGQDISRIAKENNIPVFTEKDSIPLKGDLGICIGYPHKISPTIIHKYKNGIINLHFAPLPYYRGSKTLSHAILNNEKKYGLSFHYIDESLDTGPIIAVNWHKLPKDKTAQKIVKELEGLAFNFFKDYAGRMIVEKLPSINQDIVIKRKKIIPKFYSRDSLDSLYRISLDWPFEKIYKTVRALTLDKNKLPYIELCGKRIYLSIRNNHEDSK